MWVYFFGIPQYNVLVLGLDNAGKSTFLYQVGNICNRNKKKKNFKLETSQKKEIYQTPKLKRKSSDNPNDDEYNNNDDNDSNDLYRSDPKLRQILPTMGQNVKIMDFDNMHLQFWDLPGQTGFRKIWTHYYKEVHAIVFIIDSADTQRFNQAKYELHKLLNEYQLKYAPVLILANKQDLKEAVHYQSIINTLEIIIIPNNKDNDDDNNYNDDDHKTPLTTIDETKQIINNNYGFKDRSIKVMCTCCLNKEGISDAISWLVYTIPLAQKRLKYMEQWQIKSDQLL